MKEIKKAKKVAKDVALVVAGTKVVGKATKDAGKAIAVAKTVKKIEKKVSDKQKIITVKIDPSLNKKLDSYTKKHKLTKNKAIIKAIEELVK